MANARALLDTQVDVACACAIFPVLPIPLWLLPSLTYGLITLPLVGLLLIAIFIGLGLRLLGFALAALILACGLLALACRLLTLACGLLVPVAIRLRLGLFALVLFRLTLAGGRLPVLIPVGLGLRLLGPTWFGAITRTSIELLAAPLRLGLIVLVALALRPVLTLRLLLLLDPVAALRTFLRTLTWADAILLAATGHVLGGRENEAAQERGCRRGD